MAARITVSGVISGSSLFFFLSSSILFDVPLIRNDG